MTARTRRIAAATCGPSRRAARRSRSGRSAASHAAAQQDPAHLADDDRIGLAQWPIHDELRLGVRQVGAVLDDAVVALREGLDVRDDQW
jgi:hypothetical protein